MLLERLDKWGGPESYPALRGRLGPCDGHPVSVDQAGRVALRRHHATALSCTGPPESTAKGELRHQFHHVIDIAPTILELAGLPAPTMVHGVTQAPIEGVSLAYTFDGAEAEDRHTTQYFEMYGNRGIYHAGLDRRRRGTRSPGCSSDELPAFDDDVWELYDRPQLDPGTRS